MVVCNNLHVGGAHVFQSRYLSRKRTFKTHPKHAFFRYEHRPWIRIFACVFFFICPSCPFQNLSIWPKTYPFFQFCTFLAPLNDVRTYIAWSWKTALITWFFFYEDDIQLQIQVAPLPPRSAWAFCSWAVALSVNQVAAQLTAQHCKQLAF